MHACIYVWVCGCVCMYARGALNMLDSRNGINCPSIFVKAHLFPFLKLNDVCMYVCAYVQFYRVCKLISTVEAP